MNLAESVPDLELTRPDLDNASGGTTLMYFPLMKGGNFYENKTYC